MRAQILMLRALSSAYGKQGDIAKAASGVHKLLYHHALAHAEAADALESQHREEIARLNDGAYLDRHEYFAAHSKGDLSAQPATGDEA